MILARPEALWLLAVFLPLAILFGRRTPASLGLRLLVLGALVLALARPVTFDPERPAHVVLAVDLSASAGDRSSTASIVASFLAEVPEEAEYHVVGFGGRARAIDVARDGSDLTAVLGAFEAGTGSDPERALDLAASLVPAGASGRVVLFSDGRADRGRPEEAGRRIAARDGIDLRHVVIGQVRTEPVVVALDGPAMAPVASAITLVARGENAVATDGIVALFSSGDEEVRVPLASTGRERWEARFDTEVRAEGSNVIDFRLQRDDGTVLPDSARRFLVEGTPAARVLVAADPDGGDVLPALQTLLGGSASLEALDLAAVQANPASLAVQLDAADALIMADLPARFLPSAAQELLGEAVADGLPLLVAGGKRSFGPGGWAGTGFEDLLPVRFVQREERRDPSATLVIIIDTSGSMGGGRIDLAKEVARLALRRLKPHDKAGIVEFHGAKRWAAPIQSAANAVDLQRALNRLNAGGGTVILPAIRESYFGLLNAKTRTRHVLVLTDGGVESGAFEPIIRKMSEEGMTLSTVLVGGSSAYSSFLVSLAQWGRGRFYHCPNRFNLPEIIVKQPESSLLSPWMEGDAEVVPTADAGPLAGLDLLADRQSLAGMVDLEPRAGARVEVATPSSRPLLTSWHYGLGRVSVWASEVSGNWTGSLVQSPEYARMWTAALRAGAPGAGQERAALTVRTPREGLALGFRPAGPVEGRVNLQLRDGERLVASRAWPQASEGAAALEALFPRLDGGRDLEIVAANDAGERLAMARAHLPLRGEWTSARPRQAHLRTYAGAPLLVEEAASGLPVPADATPEGREWWRTCLVVGLLGALLMILVRRWPAGAPRAATAAMIFFLCGVQDLAAQTPSGSSTATPTIRLRPAAGTVQPGAPVRATAVPGTRTVTLRAVSAPSSRPVVTPVQEDELPALDERMLGLLDQAMAAPLADDGAAMELLRALLARDGELGALREHLKAQSNRARPATLLLARAAFEEGSAPVARDLLDAEAENAPLAGAALLLHARVMEVLGRDSEAFEMLGRLVEASEGLERFALRVRRIGLAFTRRGGEADALAEIDRAIEESGGDPRMRWYFAFLAALHGSPERILDLEPVAEGDKALFHQHLMHGTWRLRAGRVDDARKSFAAALEVAPLRRDRRFAQERLIATHRADGTLDALAAAWTALENREPERTDALVAILRELGRTEEALQLLLSGAEDPNDLSRDAQRAIISLSLESGRESEVIGIYGRLIANEPKRVSWRSGLALLHLLRGRRGEADQVWRDAAAAVGATNRLLSVARGASELAQLDLAREVAQQATEVAGETRARARLFLAELDQRDGDSEGQRQRLLSVEEEFADNNEIMALVVEAWEKARQKGEALRVLEGVVKRSKAEDLTMRLAWYYEERKQDDEAIETWLELFKNTRIDARARQAVDRLLDIGARKARLAELAISLEKQLQAGEGNARSLGFLVRIYERAGDSVAAVEVLREFGPALGKDEIAMLTEMARVYQQCDDYRRYDETLRRLKVLDPEGADDYQQQIALGALERGKGRQARKALDELLAETNDPMTAQEFAAGVLAMVQLPKASIRAYGRVLAAFPDRIETHLLRANVLSTDGRAAEASRSFLQLLEGPGVKGDLFTVAVDGVLNLSGAGGAYPVALRRTLERIAADPDKAYLYQLAADLFDERRQADRQMEMTELMAIVSGERRASVLRELMDMSALQKKPELLLGYGRGLLAIGEVMPPEVFLELGEALVEIGDLATAERVFARARSGGDFVSVQRRVATAYKDAGLLEASERALREALIARPDDAELVLDAAEAALDAGAFERVARDYRRAAELLTKASPSRVAEGEGQATRVIRTAFGTRTIFVGGSRFNRNTDGFQRLQGRLYAGLEASADEETVGFLEDLMREEIKLLREAEQVAEKPSENIRLQRLGQLARRTALAGGLLDRADAIDALQMEVWPKANSLARSAVEDRLRSGLFHRARELSQRLKLDTEELFEPLRREGWLTSNDAEVRARLEKDDPKPARLLEIIPAFRIAGREALVREMVARFDPDQPGLSYTQLKSIEDLVRSLEGEAASAPWFLRWTTAFARRATPRTVRTNLAARIRARWDDLDAEQRTDLVRRLEREKGRAKNQRKKELGTLLTDFAEPFGIEAPELEEVTIASIRENLEKQSSSAWSLMRAFAQVPYDLQPQVVDILAGNEKKLTVSIIVSNIVNQGNRVHPATHDVLTKAFARDIPQVNKSMWPFYTRRLADATENQALCRDLLMRAAEALPNDPGVALQTMRVRLRASESEEERQAVLADAGTKLDAFLSRSSLDRGEAQAIEQLLNDSETELRDLARARFEALAAKGDLAPALQLALASLRQSQGRLTEALALVDAVAEGGELDPQRVQSRRRSILQRLGQDRLATARQAEFLQGKGGDNTFLFNNLASQLVGAGRPAAALEALELAKNRADKGLRVRLLLHLGREEEARSALRQFARGDNFFGSRNWARYAIDGAGPFAKVAETPKFIGAFERFPRSFIHHALSLPGAVEDFRPMLVRARSKALHEFDDDSLALAWNAIAGREEEAAVAIRDAFDSAGDPGRMAALKLLLLGSRRAAPLPEALLPALNRLERAYLVHGFADSAPALVQIARIHHKDGRMDEARRLLSQLRASAAARNRSRFGGSRSITVISGGMVMNSFEEEVSSGRGPTDELTKLWLETFHEAEMPARKDALLRAREPGSLQKAMSFDLALQLLEGWQELGNPDEIARCEARVRRLMEETAADEKRENQVSGQRTRWLRWLGAQPSRQAEFDALLDELLVDRENRSITGLFNDPRKLHEPGRVADRWKAFIDAGTEVGSEERRSAVRNLAGWVRRCGDTERLKALLAELSPDGIETASTLRSMTGWYRAAGMEEQADAIERRLLARDALPLEQTAAVLERVAKADGAAKALEMLRPSLEHSDDAKLLQLGIGWAEATGDADLAAALRARLDANHPRRPAEG